MPYEALWIFDENNEKEKFENKLSSDLDKWKITLDETFNARKIMEDKILRDPEGNNVVYLLFKIFFFKNFFFQNFSFF